MKRALVIRFAVVTAAIALVAACDQRTPLNPVFKGGGGSSNGVKGAPVVSIDTLRPNPVNVGDSIYIAVHVVDDSLISQVQLLGLTVKGSVDLGTLSVTNRYGPISIGNFRAGLKDTTLRRFLQPMVPVDTSLDSLVVIAVATDNSGKTGADTVVVRLVTGPRVSFITPLPTTQIYAGGDMGVIVHATHPDGVQTVTVTAKSNAASVPLWPTPVRDSVTTTYPTFPKDTIMQTTVTVPPNAPIGGRITFTASAIDVNGKPGSIATLTLTVKGIGALPAAVRNVSG